MWRGDPAVPDLEGLKPRQGQEPAPKPALKPGLGLWEARQHEQLSL